MIIGRVESWQACELEGHIALLGAIIKCAVDDARQAKRRRADSAAVEFAEDWLLRFIQGSQYESKFRSMLEV
jgi:hypothetical protein